LGNDRGIMKNTFLEITIFHWINNLQLSIA